MPRTGAQSCLCGQQDKAYNSSHWRCPSKPWKSEIFYQSTLPSLHGKIIKGKRDKKYMGKDTAHFSRFFIFCSHAHDPITSVARRLPPSPRFIFLSISNLFPYFNPKPVEVFNFFPLRLFFPAFPPRCIGYKSEYRER